MSGKKEHFNFVAVYKAIIDNAVVLVQCNKCCNEYKFNYLGCLSILSFIHTFATDNS